MQIKFLKSIVETLTNKPSAEIVDLLVGKRDVNEFLIAKKLNLTINQTRNILYKLSDFGLVSFIRKKDKRKGWYIYFWTLNVTKSLILLEQKLKEELDRLEHQLKSRLEKRYYLCKTCNIESTEEVALLNDFICAECEQVYELSDGQEIIRKLEKDILKLKKELEFISEERSKEEEKDEKEKEKKVKKSEKKKKTERKKQREHRANQKKKDAKKTDIKKIDKVKSKPKKNSGKKSKAKKKKN